MPVLINFKICDNDKACNGMDICPQGVFSWNEDKKTLEIDNENCISCGLCEEACMVDAIKVAKTEEEYNKIAKEIEEDPRDLNDLLVDRYGAVPINDAFVAVEDEIEMKIESQNSMIVELFNEDSIMCLLKSIPIREISDEYGEQCRFRKIEVTKPETLEKYGIKELPALLFFKEEKLIGKFEGYIEDDNRKELFSKIRELK